MSDIYRDGGPAKHPPVVPGMRAYRAGDRATHDSGSANEIVREVNRAFVPSRAERAIRTTMHLFAILALVLVSLLMGFLLIAGARLSSAVSDLAPSPAVTGCPFGQGQCGG